MPGPESLETVVLDKAPILDMTCEKPPGIVTQTITDQLEHEPEQHLDNGEIRNGNKDNGCALDVTMSDVNPKPVRAQARAAPDQLRNTVGLLMVLSQLPTS